MENPLTGLFSPWSWIRTPAPGKGNLSRFQSFLFAFPSNYFSWFQLNMAKLAISTSASSVGFELEMNLIAVVYFSCQTFCTDALLVDQNLNMRIQRP